MTPSSEKILIIDYQAWFHQLSMLSENINPERIGNRSCNHYKVKKAGEWLFQGTGPKTGG
jgi:hypothetical protein